MDSGRISGIVGTVLGVTNGYRGSTTWVHHSPRGPRGLDGGATTLDGLTSQPKKSHEVKSVKTKRGGQLGEESYSK